MPKSCLCTGPHQKSHHVPENILETFLECCQAWCWDHFPGEPVHVPSHPLEVELSPDIQPKPSSNQLHVIRLSPVTVTTEKWLVPASSLPLLRMLKITVRSPLSLFWADLSDLSCSSYGFPSRPFHLFVALLWVFSNSFISISYCGAQNCTQHSRWCLSRRCVVRTPILTKTSHLRW